jgi:hypothetical protein
VVLVPWVVFLATTLPMRHQAHHWRLTWVGFDIVLASTFVGAARAGRRKSPWFPDLLFAAGVLLLCDAWFDILNASSRDELIISVAEALCVEIPVAAACLVLSRRLRIQRANDATVAAAATRRAATGGGARSVSD